MKGLLIKIGSTILITRMSTSSSSRCRDGWWPQHHRLRSARVENEELKPSDLLHYDFGVQS